MYKFFFKRLIDIFLSLIALIVLSPLLIPVCIGLLLTGEHYIFYFQKRIGYKNRYFKIWKFATMLKASPNLGTGLHTTKNDPRIMPMGGFLRHTKINELPQLINILIGDMSIVGPRPALFNQDDLIALRTEKGVHLLTPGLTGWAQINGRDELPITVKVEFDEYYMHHRTFYLDMRIIFLTFVKVMRSEGVTH